MTPDDELLEVFDAAGRATGAAKSRASVHRDGDWHLAFFCWIVRQDAGARLDLVLQKRAADKDVWPERFDASAAGHVRFGESAVEASREIEEELGIVAPRGALVPVMRHQQEHVHDNGLVDREINDVHLWRHDEPLESYRPGPEVTGIAAAPLADVVALATGARTSIATSHTGRGSPPRLARSDGATRAVRRWRAGNARAARCRGGSRRPPRSR